MTNLLPHCFDSALFAALAICLASPPGMRAQAAPQTAPPLQFDVASVKLAANQSILTTRPKLSIGRFRWTTTLSFLIEYAYHVEGWRISGDTLGGSIYEIEATTDPKATDDQVRLMLQSLLIDRFKMAIHRVTKDAEGYALTVAKGEPKMLEAKEGEVPALPDWMSKTSTDPAKLEELVVATMLPERGVGAITGRRVTMLQFTEKLQRLLDTAVLDRTGLERKYYFALQYATGDDPDVPFLTLPGAVKDLGLRLAKYKGPVEMLVVDHIEKAPTEN